MTTDSQPDFRKLAANQFPGFSITGKGPFAVPSTGSTLIVELFQHELLARSRALEIGAKMIEITAPVKPRIRRIRQWE